MSVLVKILPHRLPSFVRKAILSELFRASADAFGVTAPTPISHNYPQYLQAYALFTREQALNALNSGRNINDLKTELFANSLPIGKKLRSIFGVSTLPEVMELGEILYRAIGVEMRGDANGDVKVQRCYFSRFYSSSVCNLISALDDGIFCGLSGGGRLTFSERITASNNGCRAKLAYPEKANR